MLKKIILTDLKNYLLEKERNELIEEILHLYKTFSEVKEYYQASIFNENDVVLEKYKRLIYEEFLPSRRCSLPKMRLSVARKAVSDYKKVSCSDQCTAEIMLSYVEAGVDCTNEFGDINEAFYISMESMYEAALKFMKQKDLLHEFETRLKAIVINTSGVGWGFHDQISDLFHMYFTGSVKVKT